MCWKIFNCDWCLSSIKSKCDKSASKAFRNDTARNASTRLSEGVINCHKLLSQLWSTVTLQRVLGQLSSGLSQGVISCQNWNVWACDCLSSWLHLAPSVSTGLADGYDHLPTIYRPHALNCTFFRLSQYCPWLTSDLMAKPALAPAHRRRNLKMESPVGPKLLFMDSKFIFSKSFLLPPSIYLILADLFLYLRRFSLFNSHDLLT